MKKGDQIEYQVTYYRTGLIVETILVNDTGEECVKSAVGGNDAGEFVITEPGLYSFGVRCSIDNQAFKETTSETLNITGTLVIKSKDVK